MVVVVDASHRNGSCISCVTICSISLLVLFSLIRLCGRPGAEEITRVLFVIAVVARLIHCFLLLCCYCCCCCLALLLVVGVVVATIPRLLLLLFLCCRFFFLFLLSLLLVTLNSCAVIQVRSTCPLTLTLALIVCDGARQAQLHTHISQACNCTGGLLVSDSNSRYCCFCRCDARRPLRLHIVGAVGVSASARAAAGSAGAATEGETCTSCAATQTTTIACVGAAGAGAAGATAITGRILLTLAVLHHSITPRLTHRNGRERTAQMLIRVMRCFLRRVAARGWCRQCSGNSCRCVRLSARWAAIITCCCLGHHYQATPLALPPDEQGTGNGSCTHHSYSCHQSGDGAPIATAAVGRSGR